MLIEKLIVDPEFQYLQPYFYNHPFALRCELGKGSAPKEYTAQARARARSIYKLLFPHGADAILFDYWIYDWSDTGDAGALNADVPGALREQTRALRFLFDCMAEYRHVSVRNLQTYDAPGDAEYGLTRRNRIVCYADGTGFDDMGLIYRQIKNERNSDVSLVSFENECILSVYDDRGCDVVFASLEKLREFYCALQPYFLGYDAAEMEKRYRGY